MRHVYNAVLKRYWCDASWLYAHSLGRRHRTRCTGALPLSDRNTRLARSAISAPASPPTGAATDDPHSTK